jgi:hypothetical protein
VNLDDYNPELYVLTISSQTQAIVELGNLLSHQDCQQGENMAKNH